ncbi:MAG: hypothetical protein U0165_19000 [Polyangiaceae bacterium]
MIVRDRLIGATIALTLVSGACSKPKPAPPPPPPAPTVEEKVETPPPTPPAAPKCEDLSEKCKTDSDGTPIRIAKSSYQFKLDKGWLYAQGASVTIAQVSDSAGVMAFSTFDASKGKAEDNNRHSAVETLAKAVSVTLPKKKMSLSSMKDSLMVGEVKVGISEFKEAERGGKKGTLGVFVAPLKDGTEIIGIGWKASDDTSDVNQVILNSINSIGPAPPKAP